MSKPVKAAPRADRKIPASRRVSTLQSRWRKAMLGDEAALADLLPMAFEADAGTASGKAERRLVARAFLSQAQRLEGRASLRPADEAAQLLQEARGLRFRALLARRVGLRTGGGRGVAGMWPPAMPAAPAMPPVAAAPVEACLLDPAPDAPGEVVATCSPGLIGNLGAGAAGITVSWIAPNDHGSAISAYHVRSTPAALTALTTINGTQAQVGGLVAGTYQFIVSATNGDGTGPDSAASNPVTLGVSPPGPCGAVTATTAGTLAVVAWSAPATGSPFTAYRVSAYDAGGNAVARKSVSGNSLNAAFSGLPPGTYTWGVRAFNAGGYAAEVKSGATAFTPAPSVFTPQGLPKLDAASLLQFDFANGLQPQALQQRITNALNQATKWRYDYLKSLALKAAGDTLQYEQQIASLMQMALTKVTSAEMLLSPVLQDVIKTIGNDTQSVVDFALSDTVESAVGLVGDAAATALSLEGFIMFLIDQSPLDFWMGLFDGMIHDIACLDTGLTRTDGFLNDYFMSGAGTQILQALKSLLARVDGMVDDMMADVKKAISDIVSGTSQTLTEVLKSFGDPGLITAVAPATGEVIANADPFSPITDVLGQLESTVFKLISDIKNHIDQILQGLLNGQSLLIDLIKAFIVYPILGVLCVSFALGAIGAGIVAAIVMAAGVELVRMVARWLTGPLLGKIADAEQKVTDAVSNLQNLLAREIGVLQNPTAELKMLAGNLGELKQLLPQAFLSDAAAVLGQARQAVLDNALQLGLAAERALGLENATAFDVVAPGYQSQVTPAPQLPGGSDPLLLSGAAMLHDFNVLDRVRTSLTDGKEMVFTHRLSLFKLLGGVGDVTTAVSTAAQTVKQFLGGGKLLLSLTEEALIDNQFPGLYRVLISDIRPLGLFGSSTSALSALPTTLPLTITHLGPASTRVRNDSNPHSPPLRLPDALQITTDQLIKQLFVTPPVNSGAATVNSLVSTAINAIGSSGFQVFDFGAPSVLVHRYYHKTAGHFYTLTPPANPGSLGLTEDSAFEKFYAFATPAPGTIPLYQTTRINSPNDWFYSIDYSEVAPGGSADKDGFHPIADAKSGIAFYVLPKDAAGSIKLGRYIFSDQVLHFYTCDPQEAQTAGYNVETADYCGVTAGPAFALQAIPAGAGAVENILPMLLKTLPDQIMALLTPVVGDVIDLGAYPESIRRTITAFVQSVIPENSADPAAARQTVAGYQALLQPLANTLQFGFPLDPLDGTPQGPSTARKQLAGIGQMLAEAHRRALDDTAFRVAKWGGATFTEDRDPQIRALGFVTMTQQFQPETAVFNLLPSSAPLGGNLSQQPNLPDGLSPVSSLQTLQYRPFENRPLAGDLLLNLELPAPAASLVDMLLEVTVRGCYDDNLAAAVRASRSLRNNASDRANALLSGLNKVLNLPGALPVLDQGQSSLQNINFSLRAHQSTLLRIAHATTQALQPANAPAIQLGNLQLDQLLFPQTAQDLADPLSPLRALSDMSGGGSGKPITTIRLQFLRQKAADLLSLSQIIPLTPDVFGMGGLSGSALQNLLGSTAGQIASIGFTIVPTKAGALLPSSYSSSAASTPTAPGQPAGGSAAAAPGFNALEQIQLKVHPLLQPLLPDYAGGTVAAGQGLKKKLNMTFLPNGPTVAWKDVWSLVPDIAPKAGPLSGLGAGDAPYLALDLGNALTGGFIHDVILHVGVRVPVQRLTASAVAV